MRRRLHFRRFQVKGLDSQHLSSFNGCYLSIMWSLPLLGGSYLSNMWSSSLLGVSLTLVASHGSLVYPTLQEDIRDSGGKMVTASYRDIWVLCKQKRLEDAMEILLHMYQGEVEIESDSIAEVLLLCSSMGALDEGRKLHHILKKGGVRPNSYLQNNLLNMYTKCGSLVEGKEVFENMPMREIVSWNAMITGYAKSGNSFEALKLLSEMLGENVKPNRTTFVCALKACAPPTCLEDGVKKVHKYIVDQGLENDMMVASSLVEMYAKYKCIDDAKSVFNSMTVRDVVSWTSMMSGYSECECREDVLTLFHQMLHEGVQPDKVIFLSVLGACASPMMLEQGYRIHSHIIAARFYQDAFVGSALVDMYAKCGNLQFSRHVFDYLRTKDVVSWTALMSGYELQGDVKEALRIFYQMEESASVKPNEVTFVSVLNAITSLGTLDSGLSIHVTIIKYGYESNMYVASALIDMYAKCGSMEDSCVMFNKMSHPDTITWNTIIDGLAQHGNPKKALECFEKMKQENVMVDSTTFLGVLSACNHAGLVGEGWHHFSSMNHVHRISPTTEHYACMVDILGRSGHLEAATNLLQKLPDEPSLSSWMVILSACRLHGNVDVAKEAIEFIIKLEPQKETAYVLLSNIYAVEEGKNKKKQ